MVAMLQSIRKAGGLEVLYIKTRRREIKYPMGGYFEVRRLEGGVFYNGLK